MGAEVYSPCGDYGSKASLYADKAAASYATRMAAHPSRTTSLDAGNTQSLMSYTEVNHFDVAGLVLTVAYAIRYGERSDEPHLSRDLSAKLEKSLPPSSSDYSPWQTRRQANAR
ncbi:hypothetical protein ONZ45_g15403 [Pleurotus djamor]|nr:hypothetical protein ONZ45_g15403 [Pleurotus djamor]